MNYSIGIYVIILTVMLLIMCVVNSFNTTISHVGVYMSHKSWPLNLTGAFTCIMPEASVELRRLLSKHRHPRDAAK